MSFDEYLEKRRQDPEYRKVERWMRILSFPEEIWFRMRMWLDLRTLAILGMPYIVIRGSFRVTRYFLDPGFGEYVGTPRFWGFIGVDVAILLMYIGIARLSKVKGWRK